ncbi:hypothetical protein CIPAW_06G054900 [Carya illinoinensis]|uniref:Uncharacterized protein n=1 Tax=Carya illinoinensis TaxID=32201 RepID=A0A8T1Q874_CARIL|nr:hypothetical protein CIPAW_06G054900 [Carya illinoinensis]
MPFHELQTMERRLCLELERVIMPQRAEFPVDYINALSVGHKRYTSVNPAASGSFKVHSLVALWSCLLEIGDHGEYRGSCNGHSKASFGRT